MRGCRFDWLGLVSLAGALILGLATGVNARLGRGIPAKAVSAISPQAQLAAGLLPDKGTFKIFVNGQEQGKEEFEISRSGDDWTARGTSDIRAPQGGTVHVTGQLRLKPDGTPLRYEWSTQGAKKASASITFQGQSATIELRLQGARPFTQQFTFNSSRIVVLDNNLYHQYAILARLYDWQKKGLQTFPVLIPQEMTPGNVTVEDLGTRAVGGSQLEELRVKTEDLEVDLYLDGGRLVRLVSPSANAEIIRQ